MSATPSIPQSVLSQRIESFANAVGIDPTTAREALKKLGVDDSTESSIERSLTLLENREFLGFADLCEVFVDTKIITKPVLRMGIPYLVGSPDLPQEQSTEEKIVDSLSKMVENSKTIDKLTDKELLERYTQSDFKVSKELSERTRGKPCIVFNDDNTVNIAVSLELIKLAQTTPKSIGTYPVGDKLKKVYRAGQWPDQLFDTSPFAPNEVLVNGYCETTDTFWNEVSIEGRLLAYIQYSYLDKYLGGSMLQQLCEDVKDVDKFRKTHRKAAMIYDELKEQDNLPKLKVRSTSKKVDTGI